MLTIAWTAPMPDLVPEAETVTRWAASPDLRLILAETATWNLDNWYRLLWAGRVHGVLPFLHSAYLAQAGYLSLPAPVRQFLRETYTLNRERVARMHAELAAILRSFADSEIPAIPFKGSLLTVLYYPDPAVRPMADLDLLVRPEDLPRVVACLESLGYVGRARTTWKHLSFVQPKNSAVVAPGRDHPDNPRGVEVHTTLAEDFLGLRWDFTDLAWRTSRNGLILGTTAYLLPPWLLLLHVAAHASQDILERKARYVQLWDMAAVAGKLSAEDWQTARTEIAEPRLLLPAFALAQRAFPNAFPSDLIGQLAALSGQRLADWVMRTDIARCSLCNPQPRRLADNLCWVRTPKEGARTLRRLLAPGRWEMLAGRYPRLANSRFYSLGYILYFGFLASWLVRRLFLRRQRGLPPGIYLQSPPPLEPLPESTAIPTRAEPRPASSSRP